MILPTIRASLSRDDAVRLAELVSGGASAAREAAQERLDEAGIDALLDDPRSLNAVLSENRVTLRPELVFYLIVRHALLEGGIEDRGTADYVTSVIFGFSRTGRAYRLTEGADREYHYLVDHIENLDSADEQHRFLLNLHLGDLALWLTGLFPDHLTARVRRRGAPAASYYERVGTAGYRAAASSKEAEKVGLGEVLESVAERFGGVRVALNRVSDRYLWRDKANPVERLLREVARGGA